MTTHNPEKSPDNAANSGLDDTSDQARPAILEVQGVEGGYGHAKILNGVSIKLKLGQLVSVVGPNGAGKSTLMKAIFGLIRVTSGRVLLDGKNVTNVQPEELVKLGMSYVPQINNVFPSLSVLENLEMGA